MPTKEELVYCVWLQVECILGYSAQLYEKTHIASFAYHPPTFSVSIDAGRVFWDIAFRPNKMGSSVNICQDVFVAPQNISVLILFIGTEYSVLPSASKVLSCQRGYFNHSESTESGLFLVKSREGR